MNLMKVEQVDAYRFRVSSQTGTGTYFVDLLENRGNGKCDCPDFQTRRQHNLKAGHRGPECQCKHIRAARWFVFQQIADDMFMRIAAENENADERSQDNEPD